jgi:hypothetical protein
MAAGRAGGTTIVRISIVLLSTQADNNINTHPSKKKMPVIFEKNLQITIADRKKKNRLS